MPTPHDKPTRQDYVEDGAKRGALVGAVGFGIIGGISGGISGGPEGAVWGVAIGALAGAAAGAVAGAAYGAGKAWWDGVGTGGSETNQGEGGADSGGGDRGSGQGCFVRGTLVATAAGLTAIELVEPDTKVYSLDFTRGDYGGVVLNAVGQTFRANRASLIVLGIGAETIRCTPQHRFYTDRWVCARDLARGDRLLTRDGRRVELHTVATQEQQQSVFNFSVAGTRNYFVGRSQVLVHNLKEEGDEEEGHGDN